MAYKAGDVILIPFPYRDRLAESTRPAVVVSGDAYNQQGDLVIAAITSHTPRFATDYGLIDWKSAGLQMASTVRMLLATVVSSRVVLPVGNLTSQDWTQVTQRVALVFA
jgi:mRNA interferase MazF